MEPAILRNVWLLAMALLAVVHLHLTTSYVKLDFSKLMEKWRKKRVTSQPEIDRKVRLDKELLKVRLQLFGVGERLAIHLNLLFLLATIHKLMYHPTQFLVVELAVLSTGYSVHMLIASGAMKMETGAQMGFAQFCFCCLYAIYLVGAAFESDLATFLAMEKVSGVSMTFLSVVFIDLRMTLPLYVCGALVLNYQQWELLRLDLSPMLISSTLVSHIAAVAIVVFVVYAMHSYIAAKLDSDDTTSLLLAFRKVLRGACDGDLVLDSRFRIVGDASSLERLLQADKKLADTNFMDLFLDTESRERFQQFLKSETPSSPDSTSIPPCLRISLQGADGPVSVDAFFTSCCVAGQDCCLLALKADPDQFLAPPDAVDDFKAPWQMPEWKEHPDPGAQSEVVEAFKELVQVAMLVNNDTPSMDVEEVTLSFMRSSNDIGMPTLRSFIRLQDWERVQGAFQNLSSRHPPVESSSKSLRFAHPVLFRIPGSRTRSYLCARDVEVSVAEEESDGGVRSFWLALNAFDSRHLHHPKEPELQSISEE